MRTVTIKVSFDDDGGYKGHGDKVEDLIALGLNNFMNVDLEGDGVIKNGWTVELVDKEAE